jgi:hypothetical protein
MRFGFRSTKDDTVFISAEGRDVTTLRGDSAQRFSAQADGATDDRIQDLLRRATGNFRHGNERHGD